MTPAELSDAADKIERVIAAAPQAITVAPPPSAPERTRARKALIVAAAIAGSLGVFGARAQGLDAQALQKLASANEATACALERNAVASAATGCTDSACRIAIAAIAALTPCRGSASSSFAAAPAPAPVVVREQTTSERIAGFFAGAVGKLFDTAVAVAPSVLNWKLGVAQSDNATRLGIAQSNNALAAQQSTNATFASFGNNIQGTAAAGFTANTGIANAGFVTAGALGSRPTTQINAGNGSPVTLGNGNVVIGGQDNRNASPGPCNAQSGNTTTTTGGGTSNATSPCTSN